MMNLDIEQLVKRFSMDCPWWTPNRQVRDALSISESTRKVDTKLLEGLGALESRTRRSGYSHHEFVVFKTFRYLQSLSDRDTAADVIAKNLEVFTHDNSSGQEAYSA